MDYEKLLDYAKSYYEHVLTRKESFLRRVYVTFVAFVIFLSVIIPISLFFFLIDRLNDENDYNQTVIVLLITVFFMIFVSFVLFYLTIRDQSTGLLSPDKVINHQTMISGEEILKRYPNIQFSTMNLDEKSLIELIHEYDRKSQFVKINMEELNKMYNGLFFLLMTTTLLMITILIILIL